jgi:regulatory protein
VRRNRSSEPDADTRDIALGLLARREHSRDELRRKLESRGFDAGDVNSLLDKLAAERLQSDTRFAESYIRARAARGFGPVRIRVELRERGVSDALIDEYLDEHAQRWRDALYAQYRKRFGDKPANDYRERARRGRFLQQRGFSTDMIGRLLDELNR